MKGRRSKRQCGPDGTVCQLLHSTFTPLRGRVEVNAHDSQFGMQHDSNTAEAGALGLLYGFCVAHPCRGVVVLRRASLAVIGDLVDAAGRARAGLEREPDPLCLQTGGNPAVLAGCFRCCDRGCCVVDVVFAVGVAVLGDLATLQLGHHLLPAPCPGTCANSWFSRDALGSAAAQSSRSSSSLNPSRGLGCAVSRCPRPQSITRPSTRRRVRAMCSLWGSHFG